MSSTRDLDPTSRVCLSCQQNQLKPSFIDEVSDQRSLFKVRLDIKTESGNRLLFKFFGYGSSKKAAKKDASTKALYDKKFLDTVNPDTIRPGYRKDGACKGRAPAVKNKPINRTFYGAPDEHVVSGNPYPTVIQPTPADRPPANERVSPNPTASSASRSTNPMSSADPKPAISNEHPAGRANIVSLYWKSKKLKLKPEIRFHGVHNNKFVVAVKVGFDSKAAEGADDLDAINKASAQFDQNFDLNAYNCMAGNQDLENDGIDYYQILNQLHLQTRKEFKSSCLLSIEEDERSLFLCKCQLGEFVSYGLDESIRFSQNAAAHEILKKLRSSLSDEIDELDKQLNEIGAKKKDKLDLVTLMDVEMGRLNNLEYDYETETEFKEENENLDSRFQSDKMFHDL